LSSQTPEMADLKKNASFLFEINFLFEILIYR
jgi:hypothetical protein